MEPLTLTTEMIVSGIVLVVTFVGIFTEQLHGMERSKCAAAGAVAMIIVGQIYGFYSPELALESVDWNVIFLLAAMMTIVSIMIPTGGFQWIAYKIAAFSKGRLYLMLCLLGTAVTVLSLLLDNVTTVVIFGPLIILIANAMKVSPIPYLLAAALLSDTGGIATLVGDPPNIMIGSAADISFNRFVFTMGPIVLVVWVVVLVMLKFLFKKELAATPATSTHAVPEIPDKRLWQASVIILGIMVVFFMLHRQLHWEPWFVAVLGMSALVLTSRRVLMDHAMEHVEITLLMFFLGLFMVVGGVEHSRFLEWVGSYITPFVQADLLTATIILMWVAAFLSAAIDNIPFTAAMIPIILGMEQQGINVAPLWWGLAMGVGLGGNGTHIGSTANVFIVTISERLARERNDRTLAITPGLWFRKGTPVMLGTLAVSSVLFAIFFDFFARPIN
ncbi:MAG TPA: ArsB/NhaD family transporter [Gammaproteobacteria bacterium]|jgi:Na+/H+ antiporter NhaD/arsenite permease-like protein